MRNLDEMKTEEYLDSTYLKTAEQSSISEEKNKENIVDLVNEAIEHNFKLVMIRPEFVAMAKKMTMDSEVLVGTVIDFPMGDGTTEEKLKQAKEVIDLDVDELDYVCDYNFFKQKRFEKFDVDIIEGTKLAVNYNKTVKWIIETGALSKVEIRSITERISNIVSKNFPDFSERVFIKTSTGYYGGFGATVKDIKMMKAVSGNLPIKASGGVSNFSDFEKIVEAGAVRVGTSKALQIYLQK